MKALRLLMICFIGFLSAEGYNQIIPYFSQHLISDEFNGVSALSVCDIDHDSIPDVVGASEYAQGIGAKGISWWRNDGNGNWTRHIIDETFPNIMSLQTIDINQDGNIDILISDWTEHAIAYWISDSENPPNWNKTELINNFYQAHDACGADLDGNGYMDIIGVAAYLGIVRIWYQSTDGSWSTQLIDNNLPDARTVYAADVDNDNDLDIVAAGTGSNRALKVYINEGGSPAIWTIQPVDDKFGAHHIHCSDFDHDGDVDILVSEPVGGEIFWWRNNGNSPIIWEKEPIADLASAVRAIPADFNYDGREDVLGSGKFSNELSVWYNQGGSPFSWEKDVINDQLELFWPSCISDMDGDSDLDFVAGAGGSGMIQWWENNLISTKVGESEMKDHFNLFPNPASDVITIVSLKCQKDDIHIYIYNTMGEKQMDQVIPSISGNFQHTINLSTWETGIYAIVIVEKTQIFQDLFMVITQP